MNFNQTWFIPHSPPLTSSAPLEQRFNSLVEPLSYAYFCPVRGEVWARRVCTREDGTTTAWHVFTVVHPDVSAHHLSYWPPGLLLTSVPESSWNSIPPVILKREFELFYQWGKEYLTDL